MFKVLINAMFITCLLTDFCHSLCFWPNTWFGCNLSSTRRIMIAAEFQPSALWFKCFDYFNKRPFLVPAFDWVMLNIYQIIVIFLIYLQKRLKYNIDFLHISKLLKIKRKRELKRVEEFSQILSISSSGSSSI